MKILFLEDEPTIQEVLTEYMKMKDYDVTQVSDGNEAVELLKKQKFDMRFVEYSQKLERKIGIFMGLTML